MKTRFFYGILFCLCARSAYADWSIVASGENATVFVEPRTIRKSGAIVKAWLLFDLREPDESRQGRFLSFKALYNFDCQNETAAIKSMVIHEGSHGTGPVIDSTTNEESAVQFTPYPPRSVIELAAEVMCAVGKKMQ